MIESEILPYVKLVTAALYCAIDSLEMTVRMSRPFTDTGGQSSTKLLY